METNKNPMRRPRYTRVPRSRDERPIYRCEVCGSDDVEVNVWYDPNDEFVLGECLRDAYCRACDSETTLELDSSARHR